MCVTVDLQGPTALKSHVPTSAGTEDFVLMVSVFATVDSQVWIALKSPVPTIVTTREGV